MDNPTITSMCRLYYANKFLTIFGKHQRLQFLDHMVKAGFVINHFYSRCNILHSHQKRGNCCSSNLYQYLLVPVFQILAIVLDMLYPIIVISISNMVLGIFSFAYFLADNERALYPKCP